MSKRLAKPLLFACMLFNLLSPVLAQQQAPAGRTNLDPASRNKTAMAIARSRLDGNTKASTEKYSSGLGAKSTCVTNVGTTSADTSGAGNRYGPGKSKDQVIVVRGPIINVCK